MNPDRVTVTADHGVVEVRLNRPAKRNALDPAMFAALVEAGAQLRGDTSVRAVVLSAAGPDFCAGLDLDSMRELGRGNRPSASVELPPSDGPAQATGQRAVHSWAELDVPVIAAVQGHALGGGMQLALGADVRLVAPDARLGLLEILWGIVPDMTGTQVLPRLVGPAVAKELIMTGRRVDAAEAVRIGLASRCVDDPRAEALELAREIADKNAAAVRWAKRLVDLAASADERTGFAAEQEAMAELIGSPDHREAVRARMENRKPHWAR